MSHSISLLSPAVNLPKDKPETENPYSSPNVTRRDVAPDQNGMTLDQKREKWSNICMLFGAGLFVFTLLLPSVFEQISMTRPNSAVSMVLAAVSMLVLLLGPVVCQMVGDES